MRPGATSTPAANPNPNSRSNGPDPVATAVGATQMNTAANAGEVFPDSDEELDDEARARREEFERKRGIHYNEEAVFALRRAKELLEREKADPDDDGDDAAALHARQPNGTS